MAQLPMPEFKRIRDEAPDSKRFVIIQFIHDGKLMICLAKYHNGVWTTQLERVKFKAEDIHEDGIWFESPLQHFQT